MRLLPSALAAVALLAAPALALPSDDLRVRGSRTVSGPSPYGACGHAQAAGTEASPALALGTGDGDPVVAWQQDVGHGAGGDIDTDAAGVLSSAGDLRTGPCAQGGRRGEVVSAPSLARGPDGTVWAATVVNGPDRAQVVVASRPPRGTWTSRVVSSFDPAVVSTMYLPPTIAVDPVRPQVVHLAYSRNHFPAATLAVHRASRDGGATWSPESRISAGATPLGYDFAEQLVALGGDELLAVSAEVDQADSGVLAPDWLANGDLTQAPIVHRARTSDDGGRTWSAPVTVLQLGNGGVRDREEGGTALRSLVRPSVAVGPDGAVHVAGESVRPDGSATEVLVATRSPEGTWAPGRPAVTVDGVALAVSVAAARDGRLAVSWLDLGGDVPGGGLHAVWRLATSRDGTAWSTTPARLSRAFDLRALAPAYVGDQGALVGTRDGFLAATVVGTGDESDPTEVVLHQVRP